MNIVDLTAWVATGWAAGTIVHVAVQLTILEKGAGR